MNKYEAIFKLGILDPLDSIISNLENNEYRDCDIVWLENKLNEYMKFVAEIKELDTLCFETNINYDKILNAYVRDKYLDYFRGIRAFLSEIEVEET